MSEENVRRFIETYPQTSMGIALDIGANIGRYTDLLASRFLECVAFEPHPDNLTLLRQNVQAKNVRIMPYAVSDHNGIVPLYLSSHPGCHTLMDKPDHMKTWGFSEEAKIFVPGITLDTFYKENKQTVSFIKCDVEGGEDTLFRSARKLLESSEITIILEVHVDIDHDRLFSLFVSMGYYIRSLDTMQKVYDFKTGSHFYLTNGH